MLYTSAQDTLRNSWHFTMLQLVSLRIPVWRMSAEIPKWWHVATQIWVVLVIAWKFASSGTHNKQLYVCVSKDSLQLVLVSQWITGLGIIIFLKKDKPKEIIFKKFKHALS